MGIDVTKDGNIPEESKYAAIRELRPPQLYTDLRMLIGFIGFYRHWLPMYKSCIRPWREHMKKAPAPGEASKEEEARILQELWNDKDNELLRTLKEEITSSPVLTRPNPNRRFYLKTDWSAHAQGAVLLQAGCSEQEEEAMRREINGGTCEFKKTTGGLRLRPVAFISQ